LGKHSREPHGRFDTELRAQQAPEGVIVLQGERGQALLRRPLRERVEGVQAQLAQRLPFEDDPVVVPFGQEVPAVQQAEERLVVVEGPTRVT
jgi:hypothetical protein